MQALYKELAKYFDKIAEAHSDTDSEVRFLDKLFKKYKVHSVLDIGCGAGRHAIPMAEFGYRVVGVDNSEYLLNEANKKLTGKDFDLRFELQDVAHMSFSDSFDVAMSMWSTFGELPYDKMLGCLKNILKPGGLFVVETSLFKDVPRGIQPERHSTTDLDGSQMNSVIQDTYESNHRTRNVKHKVGDREYSEIHHSDIFTEDQLIKYIKSSGFEFVEKFYDLGNSDYQNAKRLIVVFRIK